MKILTTAIVCSLGVNVILLAWPQRSEVRPPELAPPLPNATSLDPSLSPAPGSIAAGAFAGDPAGLRDALRTAGADESVTFAVVEGLLRSRYIESLTRRRIEQAKKAWWRVNDTANRASDEEQRLFREGVSDPLRTLFGRDPRDVADAENRYPFLPSDKRRRMAEIDLDYVELMSQTARTSIDRLKSEQDQEVLLAAEQRKDVLATLTPAERAEYEMRFGGSSGTVSRRLATYSGSEAEFRRIKPVLDEFDATAKSLARGATFAEDYGRLEQATMDRLVTDVGYEQAINYVWSGPGLYPNLGRTLQGLGYPVATAGRFLQLASETGEKAAAIHRDAALSVEQKRAALVALQENVRPQLDAIVSSAHRALLPERGTLWFTQLGEGSYRRYWPTLLSSGLTEVAPVSVTRPSLERATTRPLPRRVPGGSE